MHKIKYAEKQNILSAAFIQKILILLLLLLLLLLTLILLTLIIKN